MIVGLLKLEWQEYDLLKLAEYAAAEVKKISADSSAIGFSCPSLLLLYQPLKNNHQSNSNSNHEGQEPNRA